MFAPSEARIKRLTLTKVAGIRETLEELTDNEPDHLDQSSPPSVATDSSSQDFDLILFGASSCVVTSAFLKAPPRSILTLLLDNYICRVDPVLKVIHTPSLRKLLLPDEKPGAEPLNSPPHEALKFAICFTAICTLTEFETLSIFSEEKSNVVQRLRLATEVMLSRASLLTTSDITVLQAFVIYLVSDLPHLMADCCTFFQTDSADLEANRRGGALVLAIRRSGL